MHYLTDMLNREAIDAVVIAESAYESRVIPNLLDQVSQASELVGLCLDYDFETGSSFKGHNLTGIIGVSF